MHCLRATLNKRFEFSGYHGSAKSYRRSADGQILHKSESFRRDQGQIEYGMPVLSDFGDARTGKVHTGLIQPDICQAPEVVFGMEWTAKVDIWGVGTLVGSTACNLLLLMRTNGMIDLGFS